MRSRQVLVLVVLLLFVAAPAQAMRLVLQRVRTASVTVNDKVISSVGKGVVALVGLHEKDRRAPADRVSRPSHHVL